MISLISTDISDNHVINIWKNQIKEQLRVCFDILVNMGFTFLIDDTDIHFSCVQIDTAIIFVLLIVKSHNLASFG